MLLNKPKFWNSKRNFLTIIFLPLSAIVRLFIFLKKRLIKVNELNIPIICVGNIYVGGTGKTPLSIWIANELFKMNKNPAIVKKFYKNHSDEHELIKNYFSKLKLNTNRILGILDAANDGHDTVILDDGFQDYKIKKDLNILCFNSDQKIGNGYVFPSGPLRESFNTVKNAQIIVINGHKIPDFERKVLDINPKITFYYSEYKIKNINEFKNKKLLAFAGIGNPENFFKLIMKNKLDLVEKIVFPDHYNFDKNELSNLIDKANKKDCQIVTTEKDFFRIKKYNLKKINCMRVELNIKEKETLIDEITKIYN